MTYKPPIDVAFKKRVADRFGWAITEKMCAYAEKVIPDNTLLNGEQRMILPDVVISHFGINTELNTVLCIVQNGNIVNKVDNQYISRLGVYGDRVFYGINIEIQSLIQPIKKPVIVEHVYIPAVKEVVEVREIAPIQEIEVAKTKPQKSTKKRSKVKK